MKSSRPSPNKDKVKRVKAWAVLMKETKKLIHVHTGNPSEHAKNDPDLTYLPCTITYQIKKPR